MVLVNCFSTLGCPQRTLRQSIELAQAHDIPMVEVRTLSGSNDLTQNLASEFGQPADLTACLGDADIKVPVMGSSHRLFDETFDFAPLQNLAQWADAAGVRFLRVFDGKGETLDSEMLDLAQARFEHWEALRAAQGIKAQLLIETHGVLCANQALEAFCNRLRDAPILWDTHHTWAAGNALAQTREIIGARLAHLHVKDSLLRAGKRQYVLPGTGSFPAADLARVLTEFPPVSAAVSLEWEKHWHPEIPDLESALTYAKPWL
mgnify:CR=1 FL=1